MPQTNDDDDEYIIEGDNAEIVDDHFDNANMAQEHSRIEQETTDEVPEIDLSRFKEPSIIENYPRYRVVSKMIDELN